MFYPLRMIGYFFSTVGIRFYVTEVDKILYCPHSYYYIAQMVDKFYVVARAVLQLNRIRTRRLAKYPGKTITFLEDTFVQG